MQNLHKLPNDTINDTLNDTLKGQNGTLNDRINADDPLNSTNDPINEQNDRINDRLNEFDDRINDRLNLSESELAVFEEIEKNPFVKTEELAGLVGLSIPTVNRAIKALRDKNLINREGSKKTGHWIVNTTGEN